MKERFPSSIGIALLLPVALAGALSSAQSVQLPPIASRVPSNACFLPGLAPNPSKELKAEDLLAVYNAQAALVHSMRASTILRTQGGAELTPSLRDSRPFPASLTFKAPATVRVTGLVPFSSRRSFDMASDGREFRLLVPDQNAMHLIIGPVDAPANSPNPREDIRPQWILEAIFLLPAKLARHAETSDPRNKQMKSIDVRLTASSGKQQDARLEFDLRAGNLSRMDIKGEDGQTVTQIAYSDWQNAPSVAGGIRQACFPRRMLVTEQQQHRELEIKFLNVEINSPVVPSQFQVSTPAGIRVTHIGAPASANAGRR